MVADSEEQQWRRPVVDFGYVCVTRKLIVNVAKNKVMRCSGERSASRMDMSRNGEMFVKVNVSRITCEGTGEIGRGAGI